MRDDIDSVAQALLDICRHGNDVDMTDLLRDLEKIMDYHERERASVGDPVILEMILEVLNIHVLFLPPDVSLTQRAIPSYTCRWMPLDPPYAPLPLQPALPLLLGVIPEQHLRQRAAADIARADEKHRCGFALLAAHRLDSPSVIAAAAFPRFHCRTWRPV